MPERQTERTSTATAVRPANPDGRVGLPELPTPPQGRQDQGFAHPAEREFAGMLDFYRIKWVYEPISFPLRDQHGRVTQLFTPDFYLPDQDLYIELTTMKQSLITKKNRKVRLLREQYPDISVVLLTRRDFHTLLADVGYGAVDITALPESEIERILYSPAEIADRVKELGEQISADYADRSLLLIGLLKGVTFFMADLARAITRPLAIDYLAVAHRSGDPAERVRFSKDLDIDVGGQHILLIEDIASTGLTLDFVVKRLKGGNPASIEICTLFDKREQRLIDVGIRFIGFQIPNAYVVGYGLDHRELYRNLPFVCELKAEAYRNPDLFAFVNQRQAVAGGGDQRTG